MPLSETSNKFSEYNYKSCKDSIDFKVIFSFFLYITCLLIYYFVGIKSDDQERKKYNDLPIFVTIILYVYNCYILYSYTRKGNKVPCPLIIWLQVGLFYILNFVIMYAYFNPLEKTQTEVVDISGSPVLETHRDNRWGIFAGMSIVGLIALVISTLTFIPEFTGWIPKESEWAKTVIRLFLVLVVFFGLIFTSIYFLISTPWSLTLIVTILNFGILIGLLAIVYKLIVENLPKRTSSESPYFRLFKLMIFYIPCLFIDLISFLKKEVGLTSKTSVILLLVELIIIALRFAIPSIYNKIITTTTKRQIVSEDPVYTNRETDLGIFQVHNKKLDDLELNKKAIFNYNYALSCWLWVNPQPPSTNDSYTKSTTLLNYGNVIEIKFNRNKIEVFAATTRDTSSVKEMINIYELKNIPYQKWNNFVFNYSGGTLDIFINGKLVSSNVNITPVMYFDKIVSGAPNGIYGGIKDVVYYSKVLSRKEIEDINKKLI